MSVFEASGAELSVGQALPRTMPTNHIVGHSGGTGTGQIVRPRQPEVGEADPGETPQEQPFPEPVKPPAEAARRIMARYARVAALVDGSVAGAAALGAVGLRFGHTPGQYLLLPALLPMAWIAALWCYRAYEHRFIGEGLEEYQRLIRAGLLLFTGVAVLSYLSFAHVSRTIAMISVPCTLAGSLASRRLLRVGLRRARKAGRAVHRTVVVGRGDAVHKLIISLQHTERSLHHGVVPVGVCLNTTDDVSLKSLDGVPVLGNGTPHDVLQAIDASRADAVAVVTNPDLSGHELRRLSWALEGRDVELLVSPGIVEAAGPRLSIRPMAGLSLLHLERPVFTGARRVLKRTFDVTMAAGLLLALAPVMLGLAATIRLTSQGPALFKQTRVGTNGRLFTVYKFRSMVVDAEARLSEISADAGNAVLFKARKDPRITRIGGLLRRYSLDELPQLLNVVSGSMSLVGPRPPLPKEVAGYSTDEVRRLRVKPGMTGLWQVSGRSDLTWEESLRLDLRYVDNWSMTLDLSILWRTVRAVAQGSGAY